MRTWASSAGVVETAVTVDHHHHPLRREALDRRASERTTSPASRGRTVGEDHRGHPLGCDGRPHPRRDPPARLIVPSRR